NGPGDVKCVSAYYGIGGWINKSDAVRNGIRYKCRSQQKAVLHFKLHTRVDRVEAAAGPIDEKLIRGSRCLNTILSAILQRITHGIGVGRRTLGKANGSVAIGNNGRNNRFVCCRGAQVSGSVLGLNAHTVAAWVQVERPIRGSDSVIGLRGSIRIWVWVYPVCGGLRNQNTDDVCQPHFVTCCSLQISRQHRGGGRGYRNRGRIRIRRQSLREGKNAKDQIRIGWSVGSHVIDRQQVLRRDCV